MGGAARRRPHQAALASGSRTSSAPGDHTIVQATETYLDAASTTPLHPDARKALEQAVDAYGDPARLYGRARRARLLLDQSRERVAAALGARADEVVFTSGGTEAANLAVAGMARGARRRRHLVVSAVEHTAVLAPARPTARRCWWTRARRLGACRTAPSTSAPTWSPSAPTSATARQASAAWWCGARPG